MADYPTATDAQGALSSGTNTNPAFTEPAHVEDVCWVDIAPAAGTVHPNYVIPAIPCIKMALSQDALASAVANTALTVGRFAATTRIWFQITAVSNPAPKLVLPSTGFYGIASGLFGSTSGAVGNVTVIGTSQNASGFFGSTSGLSGSAGASASWILDFAAGQGFDTNRLGKVLAGTGSADVALNKLTINSPATTDAAGVYFKTAFDKTKQQRFSAKVRITNRGAGSCYPTFLGIYNGISAPPATVNGTVNNATIARVCPAPYNGTEKWQFDHMSAAGTPFAAYWKALSSAWVASVVEADLVTETDGTYYTIIIEHDTAGVVFEVRDASGNTIANCRTSKVLWADLPAIANSWWVTVASDLYTDYWNNTIEVAYMKYEENIGTVS